MRHLFEQLRYYIRYCLQNLSKRQEVTVSPAKLKRAGIVAHKRELVRHIAVFSLLAGAIVTHGEAASGAAVDCGGDLLAVGLRGSGQKDWEGPPGFTGFGSQSGAVGERLLARSALAGVDLIVDPVDGYPASGIDEWITLGIFFDRNEYRQSRELGVVSLNNVLTTYSAQCGTDGPSVILVGFSQGADVITSFLNEHGYRPEIEYQIAAIVLIADPHFDPSAPITKIGSFDSDNGILGSGSIPAAYNSRTISACNDRDPVCSPSFEENDSWYTHANSYYGTLIDSAGDFAYWHALDHYRERQASSFSQYIGHIVRWQDGTSWLVRPDGRHWIPTGGDYLCFAAQGSQVFNLSASHLDAIPDITGSHAICESIDPSGSADSGVPPSLPSNEQWIARNHRGENGLDFNGDGKSDIFAANGSTWKVKWGGQGSWVVLNSSITTMDTLAFGDFNCDGTTDVFNANSSIWRVSYGGTEDWETLNTSGVTTDRLAIVDADGDGCSDVFKTNGTNWSVSYGGTSSWKTIATSGVSLDQLIFADMNSDGETDAFRTTGSQWRVAHSLTAPWEHLNSSSAPSGILAIGDFGGGSKDDVFRANGTSWKRSRAGITGWEHLATSSIGLDQVLFGDFDGNGLTDIFRIHGNKWKVAYDGTGPWVTIGTSSAPLERLAG